MALLNVRSLVNKTFLVNDLICANRLDCIVLTETWLEATGNKDLTKTAPAEFKFLHYMCSLREPGNRISLPELKLSNCLSW